MRFIGVIFAMQLSGYGQDLSIVLLYYNSVLYLGVYNYFYLISNYLICKLIHWSDHIMSGDYLVLYLYKSAHLTLPHQVKTQYLQLRFHANYFLFTLEDF